MNPQRCRSVKGLGWEMAHTRCVEVRVPHRCVTELGWGHSGVGRPHLSGRQSHVWLQLPQRYCFS